MRARARISRVDPRIDTLIRLVVNMLPAYGKALRALYTTEVNKLLLELREYRKRINRFLVANENTPALKAHQDRALAESTLAMCRMEGIDVSEARMIELARQDVEPTSNKEREAMGARFAISTVENSFRYVHISTGAISQLHRDFYRYSENAEGSRWADNEAPAFYASELDRMSARKTGGQLATKRTLLRDACNNYRQAVAHRQCDPLVGSCVFTLDVLNIKPFAIGNERLARLLFQMMAYQNGYMAPRYESLNLRLEEMGQKLEETVAACPRVTPQGASEYDAETDYLPFVLMMLETLLDCCKAFEGRYDLDAVDVPPVEEPEREEEPKEEKKQARRSLMDVSLEERLAMRAAMQATAREILQKPISPAFAGISPQPKKERPQEQVSKAIAMAAAEAKTRESELAQQAAEAAAQEDAAAEASEQQKETASQAANASVAAPEPAGSNEDVVRAYFDRLQGDAAKKDVVAACPSMSAKTVERMIQKLLAEGYIEKLGAARATTYRKA